MPSLTNRTMFFLGFAVVVFLTSGCTPRVIVRANPSKCDNGIRYYRPKPYLKVEPAEVMVEKNQTTLLPGMVRISLAYLPDFSEEYAIDVRSGLGTASVGIKLEDGWNLTEINQDLDSQTDENLKAIGSVLSAVGGIVPTAGDRSSTDSVSFTVPATNVPIGFYESVVNRDPNGCKRLYGFRYVGFLPYAGCPVDMGGAEQICCGGGLGSLYGLTFQNGQMVFQPLDVMATTPVSPRAAADNQATSAEDSSVSLNTAKTGPATSDRLPFELTRLPIDLKSHLDQSDLAVISVDAELERGEIIVRIVIPVDGRSLPIRMSADQWLAEYLGAQMRYDLIIEN